MKKNIVAILVIVLSASHAGYAHDLELEQYRHDELIADLNAIGDTFSPQEI